MSLTIDEPPAVQACARCTKPLLWCWSERSGTWFAAILEPADRELFRIHRCPLFPGDRPPPAWREVVEVDEETRRLGIARVREALATTKDQQGGET